MAKKPSHARRLPKKLRVGPFDFSIVVLDALPDGDGWGECDMTAQVIRLRTGQPNNLHILDTFIHEVNHAIYGVLGIKETDGEERVVHLLATTWVQIYRDNPTILPWMLKAVKEF